MPPAGLVVRSGDGEHGTLRAHHAEALLLEGPRDDLVRVRVRFRVRVRGRGRVRVRVRVGVRVRVRVRVKG